MAQTTYGSRILRHSSRVAILLIVGSFLAYFLRVIFANTLSPEQYGLFYATLTFMMFLLVFRDFGFNQAAIRYIATYRAKNDYSSIKSTILASLVVQSCSSLLLILFFVTGSSYLASNYFKDLQAAPLLLIFTIYIFFSMLGGVLASVLIGFEKTKWYSLEESIRLGSALLSFLFLLSFDVGVLAPALAFTFGVFVSFIFLVFVTYRYRFILRYQINSLKSSIKELFSFATPVIFTGLGNKVIAHIDTLMLTYFASLSVVGVYNVILPTALVFLFIGKALATVLFPLASKLWQEQDTKNLSNIVTALYLYLPIIIFILSAVVLVHAKIFIQLLFSEQYISGIAAFQILTVGVGIYMFTINNNTLLSAIGKPLYVTKIVGFAALLNVILNAILIPKLGLVGAALTTTISYLLTLLTSAYYLKKNIYFGISYVKLFSSFMLALFCMGLMYYLEGFSLFSSLLGSLFSTLIASSVYFAGVFILRVISLDQLQKIYLLFRK